MALGIGLVVMALVLLVQALLMLAVDGVTDDYVRRFMRGTVDMLVKELAPLDAAARQQRVKVLDELFAYPVVIVSGSELKDSERRQLQAGELLVHGFNRKVYAALPAASAAAGPGSGLARSAGLAPGAIERRQPSRQWAATAA